jgi:hypothetical protein
MKKKIERKNYSLGVIFLEAFLTEAALRVAVLFTLPTVTAAEASFFCADKICLSRAALV